MFISDSNMMASDLYFGISEFGVATAHSNYALYVGIKISISIEWIVMEIFIPTQNVSFECAVATPNSLIGRILCSIGEIFRPNRKFHLSQKRSTGTNL